MFNDIRYIRAVGKQIPSFNPDGPEIPAKKKLKMGVDGLLRQVRVDEGYYGPIRAGSFGGEGPFEWCMYCGKRHEV